MSATPRVRRFAGIALAVVYSAVVFFIVGEIATRAFGLLDRLTWNPRGLYSATLLRGLPYRLTPGVTVKIGDDVVQINSHGLRGAEVAPHPAAGVERILVLGDSIVFGQGVGDDETFPARLERELRARKRRVEVLNGGVSGYNNHAELAFLREFGLALHPDRVVLGISFNDFGPTPGISQAGILTNDKSKQWDPDRWLPVSEFLLLVEWMSKYRGSAHWFQNGGEQDGADLVEAMDRAIAERHRTYYEDPPRQSWDRVIAGMRGIRDLCKESGLPLLVVIFPEGYQKTASDTGAQKRWLKLCSDLEIQCADLWPAFHEAGGDLFSDTQHPSAAGFEIAAAVVADALTNP